MKPLSPSLRSERGAVLAHVAIALMALIAISAVAVDYGVMFVGRREIQNAADAAALAAATSRSMSGTSQAVAQSAALAAAQSNLVWGQQPDVLTSDVTFLESASTGSGCPAGSTGGSNPNGIQNTCVRVDVFRTSFERTGGSPLPTFFAQLAGVGEQGVRASATAQLRAGTGTADCIKPIAIPDRWDEFRPNTAPWTETSTFERYRETGPPAVRGTLLTPADAYTPPSFNNAGSGFILPRDYGLQLTLKEGSGGQGIDPGWYYPVVVDPGCFGGNCYRDAWASCVNLDPSGNRLTAEPGNMTGPTRQGVEALINADPSATWNASLNGGRGGISGGCMAAGTCTRSPRWIAVPVFDPDDYQYNRIIRDDLSGNGRNTHVNIVKIMGFFLEGMQGNDVRGRIMHYPTVSLTGSPINGTSMFARTVILIR